ncbi:hypothetical protein QZH41_016022, partial [Actinostola sp. cb2023]
MADKHDEDRPLRSLLNVVYEVHRNDIKTYTSGHLNPSKLLKNQQERHTSWESSKWPAVRTKPAVKIIDQPVRLREQSDDECDHRRMQDAWIEFSLGPVGSMVIGGHLPSSTSSVMKDVGQMEAPLKPLTKDSVNVEELQLPEIMIPVAYKGAEGKKDQYKKTFIQSYLNQTTKADQFASFKDFEDKVICLSDANDRGVLTGEKTVKMLQNKLAKKLNLLDSMSQHGPNFHKLQIYTDIWQEIISNSELFGEILQKIKDEYDLYMSHLLDTQRPSQHRLLYNHLESLAQDPSLSDKLKREQERVATLEKEACQLLEENEQLKMELKEEEEKANKFTENVAQALQTRARIFVEDVPKDLEEQVNDLHFQIMEKLEDMKVIKQNQKDECVPISVCHHLEQCVKETEVQVT